MSRKTADKQEFIAVGIQAKNTMGNIYSDLPLFDYGVSNTLVKEKERRQEHTKERLTSTPPLPATSQDSITKSAKPKISKATSVASLPIPQQSLNVQTETNSTLLTVSDLCKLLKVSRSTLIRIEKAGHLPGRLMLGGSVRYHRETVNAWLRGLAANQL